MQVVRANLRRRFKLIGSHMLVVVRATILGQGLHGRSSLRLRNASTTDPLLWLVAVFLLAIVLIRGVLMTVGSHVLVTSIGHLWTVV